MATEEQSKRMNSPATLRDGIFIAVGAVVITIVLIFGIAGLSSQGQKNLAERVDYNTQVTLILERREHFADRCIFTQNPIDRTAEDVNHCVEKAKRKYPLPKTPDGVDSQHQ